MKSILLLLLAVATAWGQSAWSGGFRSQGPMVTPGVAGFTNAMLPDASLLNWNTAIAATPSPGATLTICASGCTYNNTQLQQALNDIQCGQTLTIQENGIYPATGTGLTVPAKDGVHNGPCNASNWITVKTAAVTASLPMEGIRITPCYMGLASWALAGYPSYNCLAPARHIPQIIFNGAGGSGSLQVLSGFVRFIGIEITRDNNFDLTFALINLGDNSTCTAADMTCLNLQPTNIIFDRCVVHGDAQRQTALGIKGGGARWVAVIESYIYDITLTYAGGGGDAHGYGWGTGHNYTNVGFGKFANNFVAASTMSSIFCGAFTEPISPATGYDGIPHDVWFSQQWLYKNPLWDTQIGATLNASETIEGVSYGPANDQELTLTPSSFQLAVNQSFQLQDVELNDSRQGINRAVGSGATMTASCGSPGACGTVTTQDGVATGSGIHTVQNQRIFSYTAPSAIPTGGTVTLTLSYQTIDGRLASLGNNRMLTATSTVTIVGSNPAHLIAVGPAASDLQMQPSYSDTYGNKRQFCAIFNAVANYSPATITWSVDGVAGGNSTVGTVDSQGLYCSPAAVGSHSVTSTAAEDSVSGSSAISVSNSAPIVGFDLKANTSKNGWELKCGKRILLENSYAENAWGSQGNGGGQDGTMLLMQVGNQANQVLDGAGNNVGYGPENISDITIRYDKFQHFASGFVVAALHSAMGMHRVTVSHVLGDDINYQRWSHGFLKTMSDIRYSGTSGTTMLSWTSPATPLVDNVSFRHITFVGQSTNAFSITNNLVQYKLIGLTLQDSIFAAAGSSTFTNSFGDVNDCNAASGTGSNNSEANALVPCVAPYALHHLLFLDNTASPTVFRSSPIWQAAGSLVAFANYNSANGGDYRLCKGVGNPVAGCTRVSPFAAGQADQASDGTDLGADVVNINNVESTVRGGIRTP
ncbi:MAG: hypothetical protein JWN74_2241 [Acidobacteriaceae bacterium]|nr:hypothetical protein [Acidobacteriaceae bacterium]